MRKAVLILFAVFLAPVIGRAQARVTHYATGGGYVSPGSLAILSGVPLVAAPVTGGLLPPPLWLAGLSVQVNGFPAGIVGAVPEQATIVIPEQLPLDGKLAVVEVESIYGRYVTYARVLRAVPGFFLQSATFSENDDAPMIPVGLFCFGLSFPQWIGNRSLPASEWHAKTAVQLIGTGWRFARAVTLRIQGERIPCAWGNYRGIPGNDGVAFLLPDDVRGAIRITLEADGAVSPSILLHVADIPLYNTGAQIPIRQTQGGQRGY